MTQRVASNGTYLPLEYIFYVTYNRFSTLRIIDFLRHVLLRISIRNSTYDIKDRHVNVSRQNGSINVG